MKDKSAAAVMPKHSAEKSRRKFRFGSVFVTLVCCFLAVLLIVTAIYSMTYHYYWKIIYHETEQNITQKNAHIASRIDDTVKTLYQSALALLQEEEFVKMKRSSELSAYDISEANVKLGRFQSANLFFQNALVIMRNSPEIITSVEGSWLDRSYFDNFFCSDIYPYEFWQEQMKNDFLVRYYPAAVYSQKSMGKNISESTLVPIGIKEMRNSNYLLIFFLDIEQLLISADANDPDTITIFSSDKSRIYPAAENGSPDIDFLEVLGKRDRTFEQIGDSYYSVIRSDSTGFTYAIESSASVIRDKMQNVYLLGIVMLLFTLAVGTAVSVFAAKRLNVPVQKVIRLLSQSENEGPQKKKRDEVGFITDNILNIVSKNNAYIRDISEKNAALADFVNLSRLKNVYLSIDQEDIGSGDTASRGFVLVLIRICYRDETILEQIEKKPGEVSYLLKELIFHHLNLYFKNLLIFQIEDNSIVVKIGLPEDSDEVHTGLESLVQRLQAEQEYAFFHIAVTDFCQGEDKLNDAYKTAEDISRYYALNRESQLIFQNGDKYREGRGSFPAQQEQRFAELIEGGKEEQAVLLCSDVLAMNLRKNIKNQQMRGLASQIVSRIAQTASKVCGEIPHELGLENAIGQISMCTSFEDYEGFLVSLIRNTVRCISVNRKTEDPIVAGVTRYVSTHYSEDFSQEQLADFLRLSKSYLSTTFKAKTGENLSDYINRFRIEKAEELLRDTDGRIQDVSASVGIFNANTFLRLFKKYAGCSPSEYRRSLSEKDLPDKK